MFVLLKSVLFREGGRSYKKSDRLRSLALFWDVKRHLELFCSACQVRLYFF